MPWFRIGAGLAFLAVAMGAFGAHALKGRVEPTWFDTAVRYHQFGALAVMLAARHSWAARLLFLGTLIFSGSLYVMSLTGIRWLGAVTPLGGLALLAGFALLASSRK